MHALKKKSVTAFNLWVILCFAFLSRNSIVFDSNKTQTLRPFTEELQQARNLLLSVPMTTKRLRLFVLWGHWMADLIWRQTARWEAKGRGLLGSFSGGAHREGQKERKKSRVELKSAQQEIGTYLWEAFGLYLAVSVNGQRKLQRRACTNYRTACDWTAH